MASSQSDNGVSTAGRGGKPSAMELAAAQVHAGGVTGLVLRAMERILDAGIDGRGPLESAQQVADRALAATSSPEAAVDRIVRNHLALGGAGGFVTGAGGILVLPLAVPANVAEFYFTATRMVAAIARVRGYDLAQDEIRAAVLLTIVGADAEDLLRKAGVSAPSGGLTAVVAQRLPGPLLMVVNKALGFRVVNRVLGSALARAGRIVPVIGGVVGAGLDTYLLKRIADQARIEFPQTRG